MSAVTLSEALTHVDRLDFVKLDVEGAEIAVLEGAEHLIKRFRPILVVEVNRRQLLRYGHESAHLIQFLDRLGYGCYVRERGMLRPLGGIDLDTDLAFNVIAMPSGSPLI